MTNPHTPTKAGKAASELLPCPFCGGACAVTKGFSTAELPWSDDGGDFHRVYCAGCQSRQLFHKSAADAIEAWNRRAPSPADRAASVGAVGEDAEHDTFNVWFEQYRMQTWLSAGCDKDRGPMPSPAWGLGSRSSLLRGWLARAALATPQALPTPQAERSDTERLQLTVNALLDQMHHFAHCDMKLWDESMRNDAQFKSWVQSRARRMLEDHKS